MQAVHSLPFNDHDDPGSGYYYDPDFSDEETEAQKSEENVVRD